MNTIGLVAIGRNEGDRLQRCLKSVVGQADAVVYVDSGSTDGSVEFAQSLGVEVVVLDLSIPFTAARARNAGFERLLQLQPDLTFVQFVDGDCEVVPGWLEMARQALSDRPDLAVVCGRRRERFPEASIYNQICDIEWDTPVGEATACGGDAMMRVAAVQQVNGFNPSLIAGEEPELCVRLRQQDWKIFRLDAEMTLHDAQMTQFSQWWKRSQRSGHAFAQGSWMHGRSPQQHWVKESRRIWIWGLVIPVVILGTAGITSGFSLLLLALYLVSALRTARYAQGKGYEPGVARWYGWFCTVGKFPELQGQLQFHLRRIFHRQATLIEYKSAPSSR
ncbi:glycosyltransferase [Leptolyngbya sp. CCY15150]|uniref:glycosyltransferase family 2 protein n=1 Tax=Leptolyngbya sp. CCY15150 TaxID=2767772 RepID=UPI00194EA0D6|nr:glycosyltransferase [Leptolyngbya sp. CCY15150]